MEKYFETYNGNQYVIREVDLSTILEGYGIERIGSYDLSKALQESTQDYTIEDTEATELDNTIYCYMDSGVLESDPTDAEILLAIIRQEGEEQTEDHWYNLARLADAEISGMYEKGEINMNAECYEFGGRYSCYAYNGDVRCTLYNGNSAKMAAITMVNVVSTIRLMKMNH